MVDRIWPRVRKLLTSHGFLSTTFDGLVDGVVDSRSTVHGLRYQPSLLEDD